MPKRKQAARPRIKISDLRLQIARRDAAISGQRDHVSELTKELAHRGELIAAQRKQLEDVLARNRMLRDLGAKLGARLIEIASDLDVIRDVLHAHECNASALRLRDLADRCRLNIGWINSTLDFGTAAGATVADGEKRG